MHEPSNSVWLHRYAALTAVASFCLIVVGALVTSNGAGDSVPSWPLAAGNQLLPADWGGGVFYEYTHRILAGIVGVLSLGLAVWLGRSEPRRWVRRLGYLGFAAVVIQGGLGGMRVLLLARPAAAIVHAALAHVFFCIVVILAVVTARDWDREMPPEAAEAGPIPLFHLAAATTAATYVQLLLGAALRHGALTLAPHIVGSIVVAAGGTLVVARVLSRHAGHRGLRRAGLLFAWVLALQMALGLGAYWARFMGYDAVPISLPVTVTSGHVAAGALLLAAGVVLVLRSRRMLGVLSIPLPVSAGPQAVHTAI